MVEKETVETITKAYEEKIIELNKQHEKELEIVKEQVTKEKDEEISKIKDEHRKEMADLILGRKEIQEIQNKDKPSEDEEKSFFDKAVEKTKEKLGMKRKEN